MIFALDTFWCVTKYDITGLCIDFIIMLQHNMVNLLRLLKIPVKFIPYCWYKSLWFKNHSSNIWVMFPQYSLFLSRQLPGFVSTSLIRPMIKLYSFRQFCLVLSKEGSGVVICHSCINYFLVISSLNLVNFLQLYAFSVNWRKKLLYTLR